MGWHAIRARSRAVSKQYHAIGTGSSQRQQALFALAPGGAWSGNDRLATTERQYAGGSRQINKSLALSTGSAVSPSS